MIIHHLINLSQNIYSNSDEGYIAMGIFCMIILPIFSLLVFWLFIYFSKKKGIQIKEIYFYFFICFILILFLIIDIWDEFSLPISFFLAILLTYIIILSKKLRINILVIFLFLSLFIFLTIYFIILRNDRNFDEFSFFFITMISLLLITPILFIKNFLYERQLSFIPLLIKCPKCKIQINRDKSNLNTILFCPNCNFKIDFIKYIFKKKKRKDDKKFTKGDWIIYIFTLFLIILWVILGLYISMIDNDIYCGISIVIPIILLVLIILKLDNEWEKRKISSDNIVHTPLLPPPPLLILKENNKILTCPYCQELLSYNYQQQKYYCFNCGKYN